MNVIRVNQKANDIETLQLELQGMPRPQAAADQCIIEVASAGVNPSDVKATLGLMPHAVWPRTPGRGARTRSRGVTESGSNRAA